MVTCQSEVSGLPEVTGVTCGPSNSSSPRYCSASECRGCHRPYPCSCLFILKSVASASPMVISRLLSRFQMRRSSRSTSPRLSFFTEVTRCCSYYRCRWVAEQRSNANVVTVRERGFVFLCWTLLNVGPLMIIAMLFQSLDLMILSRSARMRLSCHSKFVPLSNPVILPSRQPK